MTEKSSPPQGHEGEIQFEKAFARLEQILERLNSNEVSLEDSLRLYEEADALMSTCGKKLASTEQRIEMLIKNRQGDLVEDGRQRPTAQPFAPPPSSV